MSKLSHDDLCRLSRAFNEHANLGVPQDARINDWLKERIAGAKPPPRLNTWDPIYGVDPDGDDYADRAEWKARL